jgi:hypothetical protein
MSDLSVPRQLLKNKGKGWGCVSSGRRMPAWEVQYPEFKPQYHQKKEEKNYKNKGEFLLVLSASWAVPGL